MAWDFVWFGSIFSLRSEKYKYARGLLAVESNCWSAREWKGEKKGWGWQKAKEKRGKNVTGRGEKA